MWAPPGEEPFTGTYLFPEHLFWRAEDGERTYLRTTYKLKPLLGRALRRGDRRAWRYFTRRMCAGVLRYSGGTL